MSGLTPCAVIVDSRNVRGQARKMFGWARNPTVAGVRSAMAEYGLDAVDIRVGVATRSSAARPSQRLADSLKTNRAYRDELTAAGAQVLEGYLVERGSTGIEEKQVDVLCAVSVCELADGIFSGKHPAKCIVLLSEDMDLMPAYDFARSRSVLTYAAAYDTIYRRDNQRDWLILTESAMSRLVEPRSRSVGSAVRAKIAGIVTATQHTPIRWAVNSPAGGGKYLMRCTLGAPGLWAPGRKVRVGEKFDLFTHGLTIHPDEGGRFPHLVLDERQPTEGPLLDVVEATVNYWQAPTSVKVSHATGMASLRATPGTMLPGQKVAVLHRASTPGMATYLVGALERSPRIGGWGVSGHFGYVRLLAARGNAAWIPAELETTGERVLVHAAHLGHSAPGTRLRVALSGYDDARAQPTAMPVTCCLP